MIAPDIPGLPTGVQWVAETVDAAEAIANGVVAVVWPGDHERALRWATVLHGYGDISTLGFQAEVDDRRVLVSVGDAAGVGRAAAIALGRTHHHVPDLCSAASIEVPARGSVLLVAPAATLGLLRQDADTSTIEAAVALRLLVSGVAYGTVVSALSDDAAARGYPSAYLLLGEPDHAQPATGPAVKPLPWPDGQQPRLPALLDRVGRPVTAVRTRSGLIPALEVDGPVEMWDAAAETASTVDALALWVADSDEAAHLEGTLRALMSVSSKRRQVLTECLEQMRAHRQAARHLALHGLRAAQAYRRRRTWPLTSRTGVFAILRSGSVLGWSRSWSARAVRTGWSSVPSTAAGHDYSRADGADGRPANHRDLRSHLPRRGSQPRPAGHLHPHLALQPHLHMVRRGPHLGQRPVHSRRAHHPALRG